METNGSEQTKISPMEEPVTLKAPIRSDTLKLLHEIVSASYKEQNDLEESVWRTMPFLAALFGLAVTVIRFVPPRLAFASDIIQILASLFYVAAILSFTLAFGYLWSIVWPREFEHPAKSTLIRDHAQALTEWHISTKNSDEIIDSRVVDDVRIFIIDQLSNATETNRDPTLKRLSARSRTILLLLAGLAFISVSEMLMFVLS